MVVTKQLITDLLDALECALGHADAGVAPKGRTLAELWRTWERATVKVGAK